MKTRAFLGLAGVALLIAGSPAQGQEKPEDRLQSGRYAEEVEGNLRAAVGIFQSIIADFPSHRTVVAEALVRLGRAFETLGEQGAQQAYRRVLSDYPDQAEAAAEARSRLASFRAGEEVDRRLGLVERQVWCDAGMWVGAGSISPDGRYVAFVDWTPGFGGELNLLGHADLAVYDTETGRSRLLTHRPPELVSDEFVASMAWSADGERLAYARWSEGFEHMELHVLRSDGALYYQLGVDLTYVHVAELDLNEAGTLSEPSRLTERFEGTNTQPSWSPDGRRIAYYSRRGPDRGDYAVVKSLDMGEEQDFALPFVPFPSVGPPQWSADGRHLLMQGFGIGDRRLSYRLDLETGELAPEAFLRDLAGRNSGFRYYATSVQEDALRAAGIRILPKHPSQMREFAEFGETLRPDEELMWMFAADKRRLLPGGQMEEIGPGGHVMSWALSPDGTQLAWSVTSDTIASSNKLLIMPVTGGAFRELTKLSHRSEGGDQVSDVVAMQWTPDGKRLLYNVGWPDAAQDQELWQVLAEGGAPERLDLPLDLGRLRFHPDGRHVTFWTQERRDEIWLMEGFPWQN